MADSTETAAQAGTKTPAGVPAPRAGTPAATPTDVPHGPHGAGSAHPLEDGSAPAPHFVIKGNADSGLYHGEESQGYQGTRAEVWFETEAHAEAAGFRAWNWRSRERKARQAARGGQVVAAAGAAPAASAATATLAETAPGAGPRTEAAAEPQAGTTAGVAAAVPVPREEQAETAAAAGPGEPDLSAYIPGAHGEGSARPLEDGSAPHERFTVKGNDDSGLYHTASSPSYKRTGAEHWFETEGHAAAAGYQHWHGKTREEHAAIPEGPHGPGSAHPLEDGAAPGTHFAVKGNADSGLYHTQDSPYHDRTRAEVWFQTPQQAEAAGYKAWNWRKTQS